MKQVSDEVVHEVGGFDAAPASIEYRGTVIPLWSKPDLGAIRHEIDLAHQLIDGLIGEV